MPTLYLMVSWLNGPLRDLAETKRRLSNLRAPAVGKGLGTRRCPLGQPILLGGGTQRFRDVLVAGLPAPEPRNRLRGAECP